MNIMPEPSNGPSAGYARRRRRPAAWWTLLLATFILQVPLRQRIDRAQQVSRQPPDLLYISSGELLRRLSLGYEGLLADIYWTRAVQYFGRERVSKHPQFGLLGPLLRITITLDPHLLVAYRFGAIFLAERPPAGAGHPQEALQLLRRGIVANPDYWRFWEDLGFIYYWDLRDYTAAARAFKTGSGRPGAEIWMKTLAAAVAAKGGEIQTSQMLWSQIYRSASNASIRESALKHLGALKALEQMRELNRILSLYQARAGRRAGSFRDLITAGFLGAVPSDPSGAPYVVSADGEAQLGPASSIDMKLLR